MKRIFTFLLVLIAYSASSQNLVKNSYFDSAWMFWDMNGNFPVAGADKLNDPSFIPGVSPNYIFDSYFGAPLSSTNSVSRVDPSSPLIQDLCIIKGLNYELKFSGSRWINADVPPSVGMDVQILGLPSFTTYSLVTYSFSNPTFAYSNYSQNFSIPASSTDNVFRLVMIGVVAGNQPYGPIIDSIIITPVPPVTVAGPVASAPNTGTNWSATNLPATGISYSWEFPGATPATSTAANPTNVQWPTNGLKTVTCTINNGTCNVFKIVQNINITAPLPVDITSFTAKSVGAGVELNWITKSEINNDYFILQKSANGVNFTDLAKINASGIITGSAYNYTDAARVQNKVFYRLKQVDKNSVTKFSGIIKLSAAVDGINVNVYPSVINNVLTYVVENKITSKLHVVLADYSGKVIRKSTENFGAGITQKVIDATNLSSGVYFLSVSDGINGFSKSIKFIKQ